MAILVEWICTIAILGGDHAEEFFSISFRKAKGLNTDVFSSLSSRRTFLFLVTCFGSCQ